MTEQIVVAPLVIALLGAVCTLATRSRARVQRGVAVVAIAAYALAAVGLAIAVFTNETLVYQVSQWPAPWGITLVADPLAAFFLAIAAPVALIAGLDAIAHVDRFGQRLSVHPLYLFMLAGVTGAFLTGDIFNLFVWFEVMLLPSYVFVAFVGRARHTRAAFTYTVINLLGSAFMLVAIGGLYAVTGTLNMADLARRLAAPVEYGIDPVPVTGLALLLIAVFALKAGLVPFHVWVPDAYRAAPAPVTAVLAGVTKKVGIYAIIRLSVTVFAAARLPADLAILEGATITGAIGPLLFTMATASIVLGGLGALARDDLDEILAYSSIAQVGFIAVVIALALTTPTPGIAAGAADPLRTLALAAALVYSLNHALAKSALFLATGTIRDAVGTLSIADLDGLASDRPVLGASVLIAGVSLIGLPPLVGFFGKLLVLAAGARSIATGATIPGVLVLVATVGGAIVTIAYVSRVWIAAFWSAPTIQVSEARFDRRQIALVAILAIGVVLTGLAVDPVGEAARTAAAAALNRSAYIDAVGPMTEVPP
ncbi:MAG: complex I subunit 5 family protein [Halococcoides sp.]